MNQEIKRQQATRLGLIFARYGIALTRAKKLDHIAEIYGDKNWSVRPSAQQAGGAREPSQALLTPLQKMVAAGYGHGDNRHCESMADVHPGDDLLFEFVLKEALEAREDIEEFLEMLRTAIGDLEDVAAHVEQLQMKAYLCEDNTFLSTEEPAQTAVLFANGDVGVRHMDVLVEADGRKPVELSQSARDASVRLANSPGIKGRLTDVAATCGGAIGAYEGQFGLLLEKEVFALESGFPDADVARRGLMLKRLRGLETQWPGSASGLAADLRGEVGQRAWTYDVWAVIPFSSNLEAMATGWYEALNGLVEHAR